MIEVNVWSSGSWRKGHYGHSSLTLKTDHPDGTSFEPNQNGNHHYISFWPSKDGSNSINKNNAAHTVYQATRSFYDDCENEWNLADVEKLVRKKPQSFKDIREHNKNLIRNQFDQFNEVKEFRDISILRDILEEKPERQVYRRPPEHVISLPDIGGDGYGLDFVAVYNWWWYFKTNEGIKYNKFNSNCSSVALMALYKAGSRNFYSDIAFRGALVTRTPDEVRKYASKLKEKMDFITAAVKWIKERQDPPGVIFSARHDLQLFSIEDWSRLSSEKNLLGFNSNRYSLLKKIDAAIIHYNSLPNLVKKEPGILGYLCVRLSVILMLIGKIITKRPETQRANAYITLGYECIRLINLIKNEGYWKHLGRDADSNFDSLPKDLLAISADPFHEDE